MTTKGKRRTKIPAQRTPSGLVSGDNAVTDWPSIREWVLGRDKHVCQICMLRPATDVDHIWPRRLGGEDHVNNLRAACGTCNKAKGDRVDVEAATGAQLFVATLALDEKIRELEAERTAFFNAMFMKVFCRNESDAYQRLSALGLQKVVRGELLRGEGKMMLSLAAKLNAQSDELPQQDGGNQGTGA